MQVTRSTEFKCDYVGLLECFLAGNYAMDTDLFNLPSIFLRQIVGVMWQILGAT